MDRARAGLVRAAGIGDLEQVNSFLSLGVHPDATRMTDRRSALGEAVANGRYKCAAALLNAGANPNQPVGYRGMTPLMMAIEGKDHSCVSLLIGHGRIVLDLADRYGNTPMLYSARAGNFEMTRYLSQVCQKSDVNDLSQLFETVISLAAINGHAHYVRQLMSLIHFSDDMVRAAAANNLTEVRRLLTVLGDKCSYASDFSDFTPLMICAVLDNRECFDILLEHNAPLELTDNAGRLVIHYAAACGNYYCLQKLVAKGAIVSWSTRQRQTPLMLAAKNGFADCVDLLIHALLDERKTSTRLIADDEPPLTIRSPIGLVRFIEGEYLCSLEAVDLSDRTALMRAAENGHVKIVQMLLDSGASVHNSSRVTGKTALIHAAASGQVEVMDVLISRGANINALDKNGLSAMCHAVMNGHTNCVRLLLNRGAAISMRAKSRRTALTIAMDYGQVECADILVANMTVDHLRFLDIHARTGIMYAAQNGSERLLRRFLWADIDLAQTDCLGNTPLMYATFGCHLKCMRVLVEEMGVDVNERNRVGLTALGIAAFFDLPVAILDYLVARGANVHITDKRTLISPLVFACQNINEDNVRLLLSAGADVAQRDDRRRTPLLYAALTGNPGVCELILKAEQDRGLMVPDSDHRKALSFVTVIGYGDVIRLFLRMNIFDWSWYPCCMPSMHIQRQILTQALVTSGISPGRFKSRGKYSSPLILALEIGDIGTAKYLLSNLYFTSWEYEVVVGYKGVSKAKQNIPGISMELVTHTLSKSPLPLATLALLKISETIADRCGQSRIQAVNALPLPNSLKRKLAFQDPMSQLCVRDWTSIDLDKPMHGFSGVTHRCSLELCC